LVLVSMLMLHVETRPCEDVTGDARLGIVDAVLRSTSPLEGPWSALLM